MKNTRRRTMVLEGLESRSLLSRFGLGGFGGTTTTPSAAVQADQAKILQDQQKLQTDITAIAPTLLNDQAAILTAINASTTVQAAKQTLMTDHTTWVNTLQADRQAIEAATDSATRATDITKFKTDLSSASAALQADLTAVQTAITNDPAVSAAKQKYKTDYQIIVTDQSTLQSDFIQLRKDIQAQSSSTTGTTTGHPHGFFFWF